MNYIELKQIFRELKRNSPANNLTAHIIFTEDSFNAPYPLLSRTYMLSSDNKAFRPNMGGYSIFASCLDGTDPCVRLERYMAEEGNRNGWRVQDCYILERMRDAEAIPDFARATQNDGTVCYFFGNSSIRVRERMENGKIKLDPVAGDQIACGEWNDLSIDRVHGYATLISRYLNDRGGHINVRYNDGTDKRDCGYPD